jgi:DNA-binding beta-propeller fold protein YncE
MLLAIAIAGCSSNATVVGITISSNHASPMTVLVNTSVQFGATVTGVSATTVFWQVCKPTATGSTLAPTDCTLGQGPVGCTIPTVTTPLTGFGTINSNGMYTAPSSPPQPNSFLVVATSCVKSTAFGTFTVTIDSGIRVQISPPSATIGSGETYQFTAIVTGTPNSSVTWSVCQSAGTGCDVNGLQNQISSSGLFQPPVAETVVVQAVSNADTTQSATASVSVVLASPPALAKTTPIFPTTAAQGSVQQDVYLSGTNFLSTTTILVGGVTLPTADVTFISTSLLRATIPAAQLAQAGTIQVGVQDQKLDPASTTNLSVVTVRPAVVASSPDSVSENSVGGANVLLTGGFFSTGGLLGAGATSATFDGQAVATTVNSSRQLSLSIPSGDLSTPGLYPIVVQNSGVAAMSALNLAVTPSASSIPPSPNGLPITVGAGPSAVAIDEADGTAVVANTGDNSIWLVNLAAKSASQLIKTIGNKPTGVAVDDLLAHPVALVVNETDQTVSAIDLTTKNVATLNVSISATNPPLPFSIGVNPITHRAIVAYQSTNEASVFDVFDDVTVNGGTPVLSNLQQVGGSPTSYSTGISPAIAIDPRLNWAVITPGSGGIINLVDLGLEASASEPLGRTPNVVGSLSISTTVQGVGINPETHEALLTDPQEGTLTTFSLLDNSLNPVVLPGNVAFNQKGFSAAAASALGNVGIATSVNSSGASAVVVDLENNVVLQTVTGLGKSSTATAVAVDPVSNQAVIVNQTDGTVSIVSLGSAINPLQIVEASPAITFTSANKLTLTINGSGFVSGQSEVLLDDNVIVPDSVSANGRQIIATVPASLLAVPRRFLVQVQNSVNAVSNVTDLAVIQAVPVGKSPVGVAVDPDRDLAVVTNTADGTVSLVALSPTTPTGPNATPAGQIGLIPGGPITVGTTPEGVAILSQLGLAVVANFGSNNATIVDLTQTASPVTASLCTSGCDGPTGVAVNPDTSLALVTTTNPGSLNSTGNVSTFTVSKSTTTSPPTISAGGAVSITVDQDPVAVAVDPVVSGISSQVGYAAVATDSPASSVDFIDLSTDGIVGRAANLENPSGIIFDPVNQVFLAANSLLNEVVILDPVTFVQTPVSVGIGPTSLDYNFQTSTLVTVNSISHTMSVLSYVCPPANAAPACLGPQVRTVLGLGGTQTSTPVLGPSAVAIDPTLNLAVLVDQDNNRVLLVPLPH